MRNSVLMFLLLFSTMGVWAEDVPTLLILTTTTDEITVPIASIDKITYDQASTTMYVNTSAGTNSYAVADITRMTLSNVPEPTALNQLTDSKSKIQNSKFTKDGVVYVVKEGKIYTVKGEKL